MYTVYYFLKLKAHNICCTFYYSVFQAHHNPTPIKSRTVVSLVDYDTLRTTGMVLAVIMFVSGILIALSKLSTLTYKLNTEA